MTWLSVLRRRLKQPDAFFLAITPAQGERFDCTLFEVGDDYLLVDAGVIPTAHIIGIAIIDV